MRNFVNISGALAVSFVADGNLTFSRKHGLHKKNNIRTYVLFETDIVFKTMHAYLKAIADLLKKT